MILQGSTKKMKSISGVLSVELTVDLETRSFAKSLRILIRLRLRRKKANSDHVVSRAFPEISRTNQPGHKANLAQGRVSKISCQRLRSVSRQGSQRK